MAVRQDEESTETIYDLLYACQRGQRVAIVGSHSDEDPLRNQLYVEQQEDEYVLDFFDHEYADDGRLLILTGSAGDGKSALLARGYDRASDRIPERRVNMDATEARRKDGDYAERLTSFFEHMLDDVEAESGPRSAVAINYGLAVDYFERRSAPGAFDSVWDAMQASQTDLLYRPDDANITVINLSHRQTYDVHPERLGGGLVRDLLDRFDPTTAESPFTDAYEREQGECPAGDDCVLQYNVRQLTRTDVKDNLAKVLAGWSLATGSYLNPRTIIDTIASSLLPIELQELPEHAVCPVGSAIIGGTLDVEEEALLWNATFQVMGTETNRGASGLDPASYTNFETDQKTLAWGADISKLDEQLQTVPATALDSLPGKVRTLLRQKYLTGADGDTILDDPPFKQFLSALVYLGEDNTSPKLQERTKTLLNTTKTALSSWTGQRRADELVEFVDGQRSPDYRYLSQWNEPSFATGESARETQALAVPGRIKLMTEPPPKMDAKVPVPLSFETYRLMTRISEGYTPNATDLNRSHAIRMLHSRLDEFTRKREAVTIENRTGSREINVKKGDLGISVSSEGIE
jgi:DNA phosphorothioation-dependent restriction protein DptF